MRRALLPFILMMASMILHAQTTVNITSDRDNTMYEESPNNSNGAGSYMFAGVTDNDDIRRALLRFDVAGNVPAGATITNVTLTLNMSRTIVGATDVSLHTLNKDWGEAGSNAPGQEGQGTGAQSNDATWTYNFFNTSQWTNGGANGDYNSTASATTSVNGLGQYTWSSGQLVTDVQNMLDNPGTNYGWIIIGDESTSPTAKRFDTRENPNSANRPELSITYTTPPMAQNLIINEVDYDQPGTDDAEFIELYNADNSGIDLSNYEVELVNGSNNQLYNTISLPAVTLAPGDYFVICGNNANTPNCDLQASPSSNLIQNGSPDGIGLKFNGTTVIDAVSYEGDMNPPYIEGSGAGLEDNGGEDSMSISRIPNAVDTDVNNQDFSFVCATPGLRNGNPEITLSPNGTVGFCPGDDVTLTVSGDNANPQWYHNGSPIVGAIDTSYTTSMAGVYNVMTDHGFCRDSASTGVVLNPYEPPQVDLGPDTAVCQSYTLDAGNPGATYDWSNGDDTRFTTVTNSGVYTVFVTDNNGCSSTDTVNVTIGSPISVNLPDTTKACDLAVLTIGPFNDASILWNTGASNDTINVNSSGKYWVDVERDGCTATDTTYVSITPSPDVNLGADVAQCDSATLQPAVTNATDPQYKWNTGAATPSITVTADGSYEVTVTSQGCIGADTVDVTIYPDPVVDLGDDFQACNQAIIDAGNPGASFEWNTGDITQTITVDTSGMYMVTVTNSNGCSAADTVNVTVNPSLMVDLGNDITTCDSAMLDVNIPNATYSWSNQETTQSITVTQSGEYAVTVTQNGCSGSDTVAVTINESPTVNLGPDITACDEATLDAGSQTGGIVWSNGMTSQTITVITSGTYTVEVTENDCVARDTINVTINNTPDVNLGPDVTACESTVLDAGVANASYDWSTGETSQTITATTTGTYSVEVTQNGCSDSDTVGVTIHPAPDFTLGSDVEACDEAMLVAPIDGSYDWSTGSTDSTITVDQSDTYILTITNAEGCSSADTIDVTIFVSPAVDLGADVTACDSTTLAVFGNNVEWSTGETTSSINVAQSGTYGVTVTDQNGCSGADTVDVEINTAPSADFTFDDSGCPEVAFTDNSTGDVQDREWHFGDTSAVSNEMDPSNEYTSNGNYEVMLIVSNECGSDTSTQTITIDCITGIDVFEKYFSLFPNPAKDRLTIQSNDVSMEGAQLKMVHVDGKVVRLARFAGGSHTFNTRNLSAGNYLVVIIKDGRRFTQKVILTE